MAGAAITPFWSEKSSRVVWRMMSVEWMDVSCDEVSGVDAWRRGGEGRKERGGEGFTHTFI